MKGAGHALCHFIFAFVLAQTFDWGWLENCTAFRGEPRPLGRTQVKTTERYAHLQRETLLKAANVVATLVGNASSQRPLDRLLGA
jgi:hypothetical protein